MRKAPPLPFLPASIHGKEIVAFAICHTGDEKSGNAVLEAVRGFGKPVGEHVGPAPYEKWQQALDPLLAPRARNYWKSHNFKELSDGALDAAVKAASALPSPHCELIVVLLGGAVAKVPSAATAYPHRDSPFVMNMHGRWETAAEDVVGLRWARETFRSLAPFASGGVYVNFMTAEEVDRVRAAYGPAYDRLVAVKKTYDPENLFRLNQNIRA
jgi:hypothetical protein